jgi:hypothetical protein
MKQRKPVICVYSREESVTPPRMSRNDRFRVLPVRSLSTLERMINPSANDSGNEVAGVILDRSVTAARFLELLARLPLTFRGDVLSIESDGTGVLSTCAVREGRFLYRLDADDVAFYLDARFELFEVGVMACVAQPVFCLTA